MKILINRFAAVVVIALSLILTIAFFPISSIYFLITGEDISGRFLP